MLSVRRTIIHGVPVRSPVQYAGAGAVCVYKSGRAGTAPGTALQCLTHTHPPTTYPYLLAPATSCVTPIHAKVFEISFFVRHRKTPFDAKSFPANIGGRIASNSINDSILLNTYCCHMNFWLLLFLSSDIWNNMLTSPKTGIPRHFCIKCCAGLEQAVSGTGHGTRGGLARHHRRSFGGFGTDRLGTR